MNIFDFDNTIYRGESTFDFYLFCVRHHPVCIRYIFVVVVSLIKYKLCLISEKKLLELAEKYVCGFLKSCPDAELLAQKFWDSHFKKINDFYFEKQQKDDVVVSASFGFLLRPVLSKLNIKNVLCSEVNLEDGSISCLCFRKNKVELFKDNYDVGSVEDVYTDSLNDEALMSLAGRNVYLVKGKKIRKLN